MSLQEPELGRDHDLLAHGYQRLAHGLCIDKRTVSFGRVKEGDTAFEGRANQCGHLSSVRCRPKTKAQPHAAEADSRDFQIVSEFTLLHVRLLQDQARYCSSLTVSIHSTTLPFASRSVMAICDIAVVDVAPCQCFLPGGQVTTSPGRISSFGPPQHCVQPRPEMTISVWPSGGVC